MQGIAFRRSKSITLFPVAVATLENLVKIFGDRTIFNRLSLQIDRGERVGLIGDNGAGKSTLFRMLSGQMQPDSGVVAVSRSVKVGYLQQDPVFDHDNTVIDEAEKAFEQLHALSQQLRDLELAMASQQGDELERTLERYQKTQHDFDIAGGYAWRHRLEATLNGVGLEPTIWQQPVGTLSGGQRSRLALAKLLIGQPDLLLLDEPTNHLDLAAIEWLENYLGNFSGAVILISHDRYLLDRLCTRIAWLNQGIIRSYPGNYTAFTQQRQLQELSQQRAFEQQQADIDKQQEYIRRFSAGQRARQAKGRSKRLTRLMASDQIISAVGTQKHIHLSLNTDQRAGDQVLRVRNLSKRYGRHQLWQAVKFDLTRGQRVGIIGPNGSGKTTLLEILLGNRDADSGDIRWGANLNIGYYDQHQADLDEQSTVFEQVMGDRLLAPQSVRDLLAMLLFRGDDIHKPIHLLSGGERARVQLAELLLDQPNVLLLDEPTNHLDIASCEALENTLRTFPGTILCVSHDRYFLNRIAQRLLILQPPHLVDFTGSFDDWQRRLQQQQPVEVPIPANNAKSAGSINTKSTTASARSTSKRKDNPYARPFGKLSLVELEHQITETEIAVAQAQMAFASQTMKDPAQSKALSAEYETLTKKLEQLEAEYFAREEM